MLYGMVGRFDIEEADMGAKFERRFKSSDGPYGKPKWGKWEQVEGDYLTDFFERHVYLPQNVTVTGRYGDRWQYRKVAEPVAEFAPEVYFRLITRNMRQRGSTGPTWKHRRGSVVESEYLDAIEKLLRSELCWGVSGIDIIDGDGDLWEYRLRTGE